MSFLFQNPKSSSHLDKKYKLLHKFPAWSGPCLFLPTHPETFYCHSTCKTFTSGFTKFYFLCLRWFYLELFVQGTFLFSLDL